MTLNDLPKNLEYLEDLDDDAVKDAYNGFEEEIALDQEFIEFLNQRPIPFTYIVEDKERDELISLAKKRIIVNYFMRKKMVEWFGEEKLT